MIENDTEFTSGLRLAVMAAEASRALDVHTTRVGAKRPFPPTSEPGADQEYRDAHEAEHRASTKFWEWVNRHSNELTDHDLGKILRVLSGNTDPSDVHP